MNSVVVGRPNYTGSGAAGRVQAIRSAGGHPKMTIVAEGAQAFVVPYAPSESQHDGLAGEWVVVARGGRRPLLLSGGKGLEQMSFDLILGHFSPNQPVTSDLNGLIRLAESGARMKVTLDSRTGAGQWRMTAFSYQIVGRQHGTNEPTRAVCSVTFQRVSDPIKFTGPVNGGAGGGKGGDRPRFYVFKKGDTLQAIAKRFYGDTKYWRRIADANKIRDPRKVKVGQKLRLPDIKGTGSK